MISPDEMSVLKTRLENLRRAKVDVQDRITKAAAMGDLSENAEYKFAKEENRAVEKELKELEKKISSSQVVSNDDVPEDMVYIGHTVKLLDLSDDSETLVRLVGEVQNPMDGEVMNVSVTSPMGDSLMKARVGDQIKVRAPRGMMEFKILEIVG